MNLELLLVVLAKVTVLWFCAWGMVIALRRGSAALRHLVWAVSLVAALLVPVLVLAPGLAWLPHLGSSSAAARTGPERAPAAVLPLVSSGGPVIQQASASGQVAMPPPVLRGSEAVAGTVTSAPVDWRAGLIVAAVVLWGLGLLVCFGRLLVGWLAVRRIAREAEPATQEPLVVALQAARDQLAVRRRIRLLLCTSESGPMTWGLLQPTVVLPGGARQWSRQRLDAVLLHELAHVARFDCLVQLVCRLTRIVYWFHPLAWVATRRLHLEQERSCDDVVLRAGVRASCYADVLLQISERLQPVPAAALVSTAIARPSELMSRMDYLLDSRRTRCRVSGWVRVITVLGAGAVVGMVGLAEMAPAPEATPAAPQDKQDKGKRARLSAAEQAKLAQRLVGLLDLPSHRQQAILELAELGKAARPALAAALQAGTPGIVTGAVQAIARSGSERGQHLVALLQILRDHTRADALRVEVAVCLGPCIDSHESVFEAFLGLMETERPDLGLEITHQLSGSKLHRREVAAVLMQFKRSAVELTAERATRWIAALAGKSTWVEAYRELRSMSVRALPQLLSGLTDVRPLVRSLSARLLRELRQEGHRQLLAALGDKRGPVRRVAIDILVRPKPRDGSVATALLSRITEPGWQPADRREFSVGLVNCLHHDDRLLLMAIGIIRAPRGHGRRELLVALIQMPRWPEALAGELQKIITAPAAAQARWAVTEVGHRSPSDSWRNQVCAAALAHPDSGVVVEAIRALSRGVGFQPAGREQIRALADHVSPEVLAARQQYFGAVQLRKTFKFHGVLVADYSDNRIVELDESGKEVFVIDEVFGVWDVERLANGNLLLTEFSVSRVSEITPEREVVWSYEDLKNPYDADRLANGNTLIADTFGRRVIEVDKAGKVVWSYAKAIHPYDVDRLANGNTLIADTRGDRVIEVSPAGEIVWEIQKVPNVHDADRLPNGNTLLTIRMLNEVREVDKAGKTVWRLRDLSSPSDADRLPDGSTVVAENGGVRVFAPSGVVLWRKQMTWAVEVNLRRPQGR